MPLKELYPYNAKIVGPKRGHVELEREIHSGLHNQVKTETEIPLSIERVQQILGAHEAVAGFADDLGLDIRDRLPELTRYHFYETEEDLQKELRSLGYELKGGELGVSNQYGNFFVEQKTEQETAYVMIHEILHHISQNTYRVKGEVEGNVTVDAVSSGFAQFKGPEEPTLEAFNEMFTELATAHIAERYWDEHPTLPPRKPQEILYPDLCIIGDELVCAIAEDYNSQTDDAGDKTTPLEVLQSIESGMVRGDRTSLQTINEYMKQLERNRKEDLPVGSGEENIFKEFVHVSPRAINRHGDLAEALGLDGAIKRINVIARTGKFPLTSDLRVFQSE